MSEGQDAEARLLREVLEALPDVVLFVDLQGTIRYINRVEEGYDRDEVVGSRAEDILRPDSKEVFRSALKALVADEEYQEFDVEVLAPDGSLQWYRSRMSPMFRSGESVGGVIRTANITELKKAENLAAELRQLLPMCSWCDKIQNDQGQWETIEQYVAEQEGAVVTHGMCPDCYEKQSESIGGIGGPHAAPPMRP